MKPDQIIAGLLFVALSTASHAAGTIDFESVPGGSPSDQLAIAAQYQAANGVSFVLSNGSLPTLEAVGASDVGQGFFNDGLGLFDSAAPGYAAHLGNFYLRIGSTTLANVPVPKLIIQYVAPVSAASAEIWDIDAQGPGTEQWLVEAFDSGNNLVDFVVSPIGMTNDASSLDGKPWAWSFDHGSLVDIQRIELSFTGSKTSQIGLAFDNFSTNVAAVPEPGTLALMLAGLATTMLSQPTRRLRRALVDHQWPGDRALAAFDRDLQPQ